MFVPSFLALWWPKIDRKSGFRNFSRKLFLRFPNFLYQMQPRYLPYHDTLVGRVMPKFFLNKFFLNDSHQCSYHNDLKIGLFVGYFLMGWVLIRAGVYCPHLWAQLVPSQNGQEWVTIIDMVSFFPWNAIRICTYWRIGPLHWITTFRIYLGQSCYCCHWNSLGEVFEITHRSAGPRLTTFEEDQKLFVDFFSNFMFMMWDSRH